MWTPQLSFIPASLFLEDASIARQYIHWSCMKSRRTGAGHVQIPLSKTQKRASVRAPSLLACVYAHFKLERPDTILWKEEERSGK